MGPRARHLPSAPHPQGHAGATGRHQEGPAGGCRTHLLPHQRHDADACEHMLPREALAGHAIREGLSAVGPRLTQVPHEEGHVGSGVGGGLGLREWGASRTPRETSWLNSPSIPCLPTGPPGTGPQGGAEGPRGLPWQGHLSGQPPRPLSLLSTQLLWGRGQSAFSASQPCPGGDPSHPRTGWQ